MALGLRKRILAAVFLAAPALFALNPLHDARYQILQQPPLQDRFEVYSGFATPWDGNVTIPLGLSIGANEFLEFGAKLQYDHFDLPGEDDDRLLLDIGTRIRVSKIEAIQVDLQFGEKWGAALEYAIYTGLLKNWSVLWSGRGSFFEGLNGDEPVVLEADMLQRIRIISVFDVLCDLSYSTSVTSPVDWSAFDIAPGFEVKLDQGWRAAMLVTMGIAGKHKQGEFLWKFMVTKAL
ncbi:MAG: hypothetical protein J6Y56_00300 [Fibrobacterales bacterium]|nr:hypothetical protein [Fibrobacterales bacterium]